MKYILISFLTLFLHACSTTYQNQQLVGKTFPSVEGTTLADEPIKIPNHFSGNNTLLLVGYKQASQFDIDRWLIGLDMTATAVDVYEIPTIQGLFPRMFSPIIDEGMRKGIPKELWKGVITVYRDGEKVQKFTGNENGNNARVVLLDKLGTITYFYDRGFSVQALNELRQQLAKE